MFRFSIRISVLIGHSTSLCKYAAFKFDPLACFLHCRNYQEYLLDSSVFFYFFRFLISALLLGKSSFRAFIPPNSVPSIFVPHVPQATQFTFTERLVFRRKRLRVPLRQLRQSGAGNGFLVLWLQIYCDDFYSWNMVSTIRHSPSLVL